MENSLNPKDIFDTTTDKAGIALYYEQLLHDVYSIEEQMQKSILILNAVLTRQNKDVEIRFDCYGSNSDWKISSISIDKRFSGEIFRLRDIFCTIKHEQTDERYGMSFLDDFECAFSIAVEERGIKPPEHVINMFKELRFFGAYLHTKAVFHGDIAPDKPNFRKQAFDFSFSTLEKYYNALSGDKPKPDFETIKLAICSTSTEQMPTIFENLKKELKKIEKFYLEDLNGFKNKTLNRGWPKPQQT